MKLKVLTFNLGLLRLLLGGYKIFEFTPFLEDRFEITLENIKALSFDILAFQEIYNHQQSRNAIDILTPLYPYHVWKPIKNVKLCSGLMIFSKYPLKNSKFEKFWYNTMDELLFVNKGFLQTEVDLDDFKIDLANVHTTAGGYFRMPESPKINWIREQQLRQVLKSTYSKKDHHMSLITGDLNTGPQVSVENFELFKTENFKDVFDYRDDGIYTWDVLNSVNKESIHAKCPSQRIDHILYKPMQKKEIVHTNANILFKEPIVSVGLLKKKKITLSDHYAVTTELEVLK